MQPEPPASPRPHKLLMELFGTTKATNTDEADVSDVLTCLKDAQSLVVKLNTHHQSFIYRHRPGRTHHGSAMQVVLEKGRGASSWSLLLARRVLSSPEGSPKKRVQLSLVFGSALKSVQHFRLRSRCVGEMGSSSFAPRTLKHVQSASDLYV